MTIVENRCILRRDLLFAVTYYKGRRTRNRALFRIAEGRVLFKDPVSGEETQIGEAVVTDDQVVVVFRKVHIE